MRVAGPGDAADVAELMCGFRDWWGYAEPSDAVMRDGVERLLGDPATDYLIGGDPPAGVCQLRYRYGVWLAGEDCWLEDLYVRDEARGSGLGTELVQAAVARARARGCRRVELDVNEANAPARALYQGLGFSSWAEPPGGDTLLMRLRLV